MGNLILLIRIFLVFGNMMIFSLYMLTMSKEMLTQAPVILEFRFHTRGPAFLQTCGEIEDGVQKLLCVTSFAARFVNKCEKQGGIFAKEMVRGGIVQRYHVFLCSQNCPSYPAEWVIRAVK